MIEIHDQSRNKSLGNGGLMERSGWGDSQHQDDRDSVVPQWGCTEAPGDEECRLGLQPTVPQT